VAAQGKQSSSSLSVVSSAIVAELKVEDQKRIKSLEEKKKGRRERNRESKKRSRERKKVLAESLQ
jgi:hypothetical protein